MKADAKVASAPDAAHVELDHRSSRLLKEDIPDMDDSDVTSELRETRR